MRRAVVLGALGVALSLVVVLAYAITTSLTKGSSTPNVSIANLPASSSLKVGAAVPKDFVLQRLGGGSPIYLAHLLDGRAAVINVFASWCPACTSELRAFSSIATKPAAKGVVFIGIDTNDPDRAKVAALLKKDHIAYPVGIDTPDLGVASAYGIANLPTTLYLDHHGRLVASALGAQTSSDLLTHLRALR
jgi:thiol-disulfide isomerase/thioredoxin